MQGDAGGSIETARSWQAAFLALVILSVAFGSPLLVVVGMREMQAALHTDRSVLALASALVWIGNGVGGIPMGWLADRIGIRSTAATGTIAMAAGMALSSMGTVWALYIGHGLLIGLLGNGALYAPLIVYVSRWFDRRRGTALELISSGQYVAGIIWPSVLEAGMKHFGWQPIMLGYGAVVLAILPLLALCGRRPSRRSSRPVRRFRGLVTGCWDCIAM
jgi:MFS family permease